MHRLPQLVIGVLLILALSLAGCVTVEAPAADVGTGAGATSDSGGDASDAEETVLMIIPAEISGAGSVPGNNWADGAKLAIEDVNAAGGILGKLVEYKVLDTQTDPETSKLDFVHFG